jgi:hypothetical protein
MNKKCVKNISQILGLLTNKRIPAMQSEMLKIINVDENIID